MDGSGSLKFLPPISRNVYLVYSPSVPRLEASLALRHEKSIVSANKDEGICLGLGTTGKIDQSAEKKSGRTCLLALATETSTADRQQKPRQLLHMDDLHRIFCLKARVRCEVRKRGHRSCLHAP